MLSIVGERERTHWPVSDVGIRYVRMRLECACYGYEVELTCRAIKYIESVICSDK